MSSSKNKHIHVSSGGIQFDSCQAVILVPEVALSESGHIRTFSTTAGPQAKHEFYAIAQTALLQYQDEELEVIPADFPIEIKRGNKTEAVITGMVIMRMVSGEMVVLTNASEAHRKLLEAAHRFCTRWVRLDF